MAGVTQTPAPPPKYAWRVIDPAGRPTSVVVCMADDTDTQTIALVHRAAEQHGVLLEPLWPDDAPALAEPP